MIIAKRPPPEPAGTAASRRLACVALLVATLLTPACTAFFSDMRGPERTRSSMVEFLYPDEKTPDHERKGIPRLELPLKVGVAFVPTRGEMAGRLGSDALTPDQRLELLEAVSEQFRGADYVKSIEVVPSIYLQNNRGFEALEQTARLYDLDVFALVSWDQMTTSDDTAASVLYWTIIGSYVIPASRNTVHTLLDIAVFDLDTRTLLLRAPGTDHAKGQSTAIAAAAKSRQLAAESFERAAASMTENLKAEIERFGEKVKEDGSVQIAYAKSKGTRAASAPWLLLLALAVAAAGVGFSRPKRLSS